MMQFFQLEPDYSDDRTSLAYWASNILREEAYARKMAAQMERSRGAGKLPSNGWSREAAQRGLRAALVANANRQRTIWTRDRSLQALRDWHQVHGHWPTTSEWERAGQGHPAWVTLRGLFGSRQLAIEAAA